MFLPISLRELIISYLKESIKKLENMALKNDIVLEDESKLLQAFTFIVRFNNITYISPKMNELYLKNKKQFMNFINEVMTEIKHKITTEAKLTNLFVEHKNGEKNVFPTAYSKTDVSEFFAENYGFYKLGDRQISQTMQNILSAF